MNWAMKIDLLEKVLYLIKENSLVKEEQELV